MFTGIVEELGHVRHCRPDGAGFSLAVDCDTVLEGTRPGDSIAVNGVCLTVTELDADGFVTGLAPETRSRTALDALEAGTPVNLERSVTPSTRMGGHFVQGHVDATGQVVERREDADALWVTVQVPEALMRYIVRKGYVAVDGTSLTVVNTHPDRFDVTLVAYTQAHVTLPQRALGAAVNIEVDVVGKYVERLVMPHLDAAAAEQRR